jgi:hypothetical protein
MATSCGSDSSSTVAYQVGDQQLTLATFELARSRSPPIFSTAWSWISPSTTFDDAQMNDFASWKRPLQRLRTRKGNCFWDSGEWALQDKQGATMGEQLNRHDGLCL